MTKREGRRVVAFSTHASGPPIQIARIEAMESLSITERRSGASRLGLDVRTFRPYAKPDLFAKQQDENGHLAAEARIIGLLMNHIGETVVSLACGSGWLDQQLVRMAAEDIVKGRRKKLMLLGIDSSPESIEKANARMKEELYGNPETKKLPNLMLKKLYDEGKFDYQYMVAMLGGSTSTKYNGKIIKIPNFADIDLRQTVIRRRSSCTFIAFMVFALWVDHREAAIKSVAEKCRRPTLLSKGTVLINGEEHPTHITPSKIENKEFLIAVDKRIPGEVSPVKLWDGAFAESGFVKMSEGSVPFELGDSDHFMRYAVLRFYGTK